MRRAAPIGIGYRASSPADIIEALARRSLVTIPAAKPLALCTTSDKEQEPSTQAATLVGPEAHSLLIVRRVADGGANCGVAALRWEHR